MGICERIREERERLRLSQEELGVVGGVRKQAQLLYEKGERHPDTRYLAAIAASGADVLYILTGQRSQTVSPQSLLPEGDRILLDNFHAAPTQVQAGVKTALSAFTPSANRLNSKGAAKRKA